MKLYSENVITQGIISLCSYHSLVAGNDQQKHPLTFCIILYVVVNPKHPPVCYTCAAKLSSSRWPDKVRACLLYSQMKKELINH